MYNAQSALLNKYNNRGLSSNLEEVIAGNAYQQPGAPGMVYRLTNSSQQQMGQLQLCNQKSLARGLTKDEFYRQQLLETEKHMDMCNYVKEKYNRFHECLKYQDKRNKHIKKLMEPSNYSSITNAAASKQAKSQKIIANLYTAPEEAKGSGKGQQVPDYLVDDHPTEIP